ncbi:MAG: glycosyltransferase [Acidobacteria bacterium]|nr:glycosyltransferase [Acidobacteriota bacterium]
MSTSLWIINPYGSLPSESWSTYRSTMLAQCLATHGYTVTQFISNFEHRSKTFRAEGQQVIAVDERYSIEIVPSTPYDSHISVDRVRYERTFARNLLARTAGRSRPEFIVLAEPALFYYDILLGPLLTADSALVLDVIDIWPELFALVLPKRVRSWSSLLLAPLYQWRKRLYRHADGVVAVARDYLEIARSLVSSADVPLEVVYWSYNAREVHGEPTPPIVELVSRKQPQEVWAIYAGTLGANYDIPSIIRLARRSPSAAGQPVALKIIVAGDGPLAELCRRSSSDTFIFCGRLGPADLALLYRHADIALSTYRGDSTVAMPIKAFDYLRYGLPMVNSLERDLGDIVRKYQVGINYDAESPSSLADAVERLASDEPLRRTMSANAKALAPSFSVEQQYPAFVRLLDQVAAHRGRKTQ